VGLAYVLAQQNRFPDALAHLQKAIALRPEDEVAWYRLSQVQRSIGNTGEADQARVKFQELRLQKSKQQEPELPIYSTDEVTRQTIDNSLPN